MSQPELDASREKKRLYAKAWRAKRRASLTPEQLEAERQKEREAYHANRSEYRAYQKAYRDAHPEQRKASYRRYYEANREKLLAKMKARWESKSQEAKRQHYEKRKRYPRKKTTGRCKKYLRFTHFRDAVKMYYGCCNPACRWEGPHLHPSQLDYHHVDGVKGQNVAAAGSFRSAVVEINKCTVLCACCHRLATYAGLDCSEFRRCRVTEAGEVVGPV